MVIVSMVATANNIRYGRAKIDPVALLALPEGVGARRFGAGVWGWPSTALRAGEGSVCEG